MSDPLPNCVVDVRFDGESAAHFSYSCSNSTRGWQVYPNGSIYPAIPGRVVQFRIKGVPGTVIAGFQISRDELSTVSPSHRWTRLPDGREGEGLVKSKPEGSYPADPDSTETFTELTFELGVQRWFYRLAAVVPEDGGFSELMWDDPRIHDDGSQ